MRSCEGALLNPVRLGRIGEIVVVSHAEPHRECLPDPAVGVLPPRSPCQRMVPLGLDAADSGPDPSRRVDGRLVSSASTRHPEPVTLRPTIRPGAPLLRRDATHLQVGTSPGTVIDDRPGLRPFLRLLNGARDVDQLRRLVRAEVPELEGEVDDVLGPLLACGAVVDASRLQVRRPRLRVALHDDAGSRPLARAIGHALADLGIGSLDPDLLLVVSCGEPPRAVFDQARRHQVSHLPVVIDEDRVRIGPVVIPGVTPCLTCLDQHMTYAG